MAHQHNHQSQPTEPDERSSDTAPHESGDPGRTPGSAEGDEQTIDESLAQKET